MYGLRAATPGEPVQVTVRDSDISATIPAGHRLVVWVMAGDVAWYKPFAASAGGALGAGPLSTITLPLR